MGFLFFFFFFFVGSSVVLETNGYKRRNKPAPQAMLCFIHQSFTNSFSKREALPVCRVLGSGLFVLWAWGPPPHVVMGITETVGGESLRQMLFLSSLNMMSWRAEAPGWQIFWWTGDSRRDQREPFLPPEYKVRSRLEPAILFPCLGCLASWAQENVIW